ncbi:MAG: (Fe-S)-binding protein [Acidimicrobiia bacterium]|nr:(Fe-S)-binding protein [Acidimicrobiia bacterium]MYB08559.1 (Fe-S)-binding protein [Acidimicrobiia bacterium]MYB75451.1 (Fe-S)-binding protein [Acidimicrobiia bacterium]MYG59235.1 (Fe-S)-binding protein [Acidimicrobiia bacterium]MYH98821.1 (Fe-S)-binding protein [Acidimicrobiia bacterium]
MSAKVSLGNDPEGSASRPTLGIDPEELASCVSCGLCLPHCPTFRVTGEEWASPRGRISAMREVQDNGAAVDAAFLASMNSCVQCRGCEPACPSGVPFGSLMEATQASLARRRRGDWRRWGFRVLGHRWLLNLLSRTLAIVQRMRLVPSKRLGLPLIPLAQERLRASGDDVWLFTGCVMDAWQRSTHAAVKRVVEATGAGISLPGAGAGCCGALSLHAGLEDHARALAIRTMRALEGSAPILVDSAGCGAALKEYGELVGTPEAAAFSRRVMDVHEWLAPRLEELPGVAVRSSDAVVAVHDPCHLRHVQRAHHPVAEVLARFATVVALDDEGLCCGAGGAYAAMQPELAASIRERKLEAIERTGAQIVASANPGCTIHLANAGVVVRHPLEIVDEAIDHDG